VIWAYDYDSAAGEIANRRVLAFQADGQPVISVDTKKKELVGNYGLMYQPPPARDGIRSSMLHSRGFRISR
jgi:hypothetical protein